MHVSIRKIRVQKSQSPAPEISRVPPTKKKKGEIDIPVMPAALTGDHSIGDGVGNRDGTGDEVVETERKSRRELIESIWEENQGPYEGMVFDTRDAARVFYNEYARRVGFGTRAGSARYSRRDHSVIAQRFVCSKEGFSKPRRKKDAAFDGKVKLRRAFKRVGCHAMIAVKRTELGKWVVYRIEKRHNHPLVAQQNVRYLRSHRDAAETARTDGVDLNGSLAVSHRDESGEACGRVGFVDDDCWNYIRFGRQRIIGSDAQNFLEYFKRMRAENPSFFCAMQVDEDQCVSNIFWADSRARIAYSFFGDAVTFDTTHKSSKLPFVQFTGINHHEQPVLFGCALLLDESESSLVWLFRTWLEAMSGRHPISITTIPDMDIRTAIKKVFPVTRLRICKWYVFRELQEKFSYLYHLYPTIEGEFCGCINMAETAEEFESSWWSLLDRYGLRDNKWIQSLYTACHDWVPAYLRDTFFGEFSCTKGSEGSNSIFVGYINEETSLQEFIGQYKKALENQYEQEEKADFDTIHTSPVLKTPSPMEKQVAGLYTRRVFSKFQEELVDTFVYIANKIEDDGSNSIFKVAKYEEEHRDYTVLFNVLEKKASCSCQMFEFSGILCTHVLTVFRVTNILTMPPNYILNRWTRNAKTGPVLDDYSVELQGNSRESLTLRYNNLRHQAIKFVEEGARSLDIYDVAIAAIREAASKVAAAKKNIMRVSRDGDSASGCK